MHPHQALLEELQAPEEEEPHPQVNKEEDREVTHHPPLLEAQEPQLEEEEPIQALDANPEEPPTNQTNQIEINNIYRELIQLC